MRRPALTDRHTINRPRGCFSELRRHSLPHICKEVRSSPHRAGPTAASCVFREAVGFASEAEGCGAIDVFLAVNFV